MSTNTPKACSKCEGTGRYRDPRYWGTMPGSTNCPDCNGTGTEQDIPAASFPECPTCGQYVRVFTMAEGTRYESADDDDVGCELSRIESDMLEISDALADVGLPGLINADSILERIDQLVAAKANHQQAVSVAVQAEHDRWVEKLRVWIADERAGLPPARFQTDYGRGVAYGVDAIEALLGEATL